MGQLTKGYRNEISKPILFNTDMVRAILDGRKTVTRRVVKRNGQTPTCYGREYFNGLRDELNGDTSNLWAGFYKEKDIFFVNGEKRIDAVYFKAPYQPGDILYVRETFFEYKGRYRYKADGDYIALNALIGGKEFFKWRPSIHMPKEAARIFLQVTNVRVERLQDITTAQTIAEGAIGWRWSTSEGCSVCCTDCTNTNWVEPPIVDFVDTWNSTIKPADLPCYGWTANPWVWVIEFERISKEEALQNE